MPLTTLSFLLLTISTFIIGGLVTHNAWKNSFFGDYARMQRIENTFSRISSIFMCATLLAGILQFALDWWLLVPAVPVGILFAHYITKGIQFLMYLVNR